jgi:hypothetical protein
MGSSRLACLGRDLEEFPPLPAWHRDGHRSNILNPLLS